MAKLDELSIFFPFWNEEENVENVVNKALKIAPRVANTWEIIMVDDGSSDKTLQIMKKMSLKDKRLIVVTHKQNRGYGAGLRSGFEHARYDFVVFNDGDGQFDLAEVDKFIEKIKDSDLVIGYRKKRLDHPFRHLLMNMLKVWDYIFFRFKFKDIDCGFKLFRKTAIETIYPLKSEGAMITTEILAKAKKHNLKIKQVEVSHYPRLFGDQSGGNLRVILRAVKESLLLWKELNSSYGRN